MAQLVEPHPGGVQVPVPARLRASPAERGRAVWPASIRLAFSWRLLWLTIALIAATLLINIPRIGDSFLRDNFDVYLELMLTPATLIAPLVAAVIGCLPLFRELGNRFASSTRTRLPLRSYLQSRLVAALIGPFVAFFAFAFALFAIAFFVWPLLGNPSIHPDLYSMTAAQADADSLTRTTYSQLLALSPWGYGLLYAAWAGFGAATYSALGFAALLALPNRAVALAVPMILYIVETLAASLLDAPRFGLIFSLFPFGLAQAPIWQAAAPTLLLAGLTAGTLLWLVRAAGNSARLS